MLLKPISRLALTLCLTIVACKKNNDVVAPQPSTEAPKTISDTIKKLQGEWVCRGENKSHRAYTGGTEPGIDTLVDLHTSVTVFVKNDSLISASCKGYNENFVFGKLGGWDASGGVNLNTDVLSWSGYSGNTYVNKSWHIAYYYLQDSIVFYEVYRTPSSGYELFLSGRRK